MGLCNINVDVTLTEINCGCCGGTYAINERYREQQYRDGGSWNCPYCKTGWGYGENNERSNLEKKLEREKKLRRWAEENANKLLKSIDVANRRIAAHKGVSTRMKNRAKAGVCPCCTRTFKQLAAHMKNKHPDYVKEGKK